MNHKPLGDDSKPESSAMSSVVPLGWKSLRRVQICSVARIRVTTKGQIGLVRRRCKSMSLGIGGFRTLRSETDQPIQNDVANLELTQLRRGLAPPLRVDDCNNIGIGRESCIRARYVVGHNEVEHFPSELVDRIAFEIFGFCSKSDQQPVALLCGEPGEFIVDGGELESHSLRIFLELMSGGFGWTKISDCRCHYQDGTPREDEGGCPQQIGCTDSVDALHTRGRGQTRGAGHQTHGGSAAPCGLCDGEAHFAGGTIRHEAHRVDSFLGGPRRYQDPLSGKILAGEHPDQLLDNESGLRQTALTLITTSQLAGGRFHDSYTSSP